MAKTIGVCLRFASQAALLVVVALHAHWSVALILTLLTINSELTALVIKAVARPK